MWLLNGDCLSVWMKWNSSMKSWWDRCFLGKLVVLKSIKYDVLFHFPVTLIAHLHKPFQYSFKPTFYLLMCCFVQQRFPLSSHGETLIFLLKHPPNSSPSAKFGPLVPLRRNAMVPSINDDRGTRVWFILVVAIIVLLSAPHIDGR